MGGSMQRAGWGLLAAIVGAGFGHGAMATDLAAPVPAAGWSGWYAGLTAGYAKQTNCSTLTPQGFWPGFAPDAAELARQGTGCADPGGLIGGVEVGANYQVGNWVFGIEADVSALNRSTTRVGSGTYPVTPATGTVTETATTNWLATFRPRVGVIVDNTLFYVTGGVAMAGVNASGTMRYYDDPGGGPRGLSNGSVSTVTGGWTLGAGAEMMIGGGWTLKAEYLYADLAAVKYNTAYDITPPLLDFRYFSENVGVTTQIHSFRVGANYRFGSFDPAMPAAFSGSPHDWTGLYGGINLGGGRGSTTATDVDCCGNGPYFAVGDTFTAATGGVTGGAQAGYNWQSGGFVAGVEADVGYLGLKGSHASSLPAAPDVMAMADGGLYATLRGRVGVATDRALFYATGGAIFANLHAGVEDGWYTDPDSWNLLFTGKTGMQTGWTVGGGLEYALNDKWSIKGEYLYFDLGTTRVVGPAAATDPPNLFGYDIRNTGSIGRIGVNRKF